MSLRDAPHPAPPLQESWDPRRGVIELFHILYRTAASRV